MFFPALNYAGAHRRHLGDLSIYDARASQCCSGCMIQAAGRGFHRSPINVYFRCYELGVRSPHRSLLIGYRMAWVSAAGLASLQSHSEPAHVDRKVAMFRRPRLTRLIPRSFIKLDRPGNCRKCGAVQVSATRTILTRLNSNSGIRGLQSIYAKIVQVNKSQLRCSAIL